MASSKDRLAAKLIERALEFQRLAPWREFGAEDLFQLEIPGEEHPVLAAVMGSAGDRFGLTLYRGPDAMEPILRSLEGEPERQLLWEQSLLGFHFERLDRVDSFAREYLDQAGFSARWEASAPIIGSKPPGEQVRSPNEGESYVLLYALSGFLRVWQAGELKPRNLRHEAGLQRTILSGDPAGPDHLTIDVPFPEPPPLVPIELDLSGLPILDECWLITVTELDGRVEGNDRMQRGLLVVDEDTQAPLCCHDVPGIDIREASVRVAAHVRGENDNQRIGLPREAWFASKSLFDLLRAALEAAGVKVQYVPRQPRLEAVVELMCAILRVKRELEQVPLKPVDPELLRWMGEELDLTHVLRRQLKQRENERYRALQRYFGDADLGELLLCKPGGFGIQTAFIEWRAAQYRHSRTAPTLVERLLATQLSHGQRELLLARQRWRPALYRVVSSDPAAGMLQVANLFTDEQTAVFHPIHAMCLRANQILPLVLLPAGKFTLMLIQGPPITPKLAGAALAWLKSKRLQPNARAFAKNPHLLGRLWKWFDDVRNAPPAPATNTDGEPLELLAACFSLDDPDAVLRALRQRDDIDPPDDDEEPEFAWIRRDSPTDPFLRFLGHTPLGSIEIVGDELLLEVNSKVRLEQARDWLERIPGVRFQSMRTRDVMELFDSPLDDRLPDLEDEEEEEEIPPDDVVELGRAMVHWHAMNWLDEKLPALGGKTPRQAVKTAALREQVAVMIRAWPSDFGIDGEKIEPPRQEMLKELGL